MQGVLELQIFIGEFQFFEEEEDDAIDDNAQLVLNSRVNDGPKKIHVVSHEQPLED
jgi:hypothetical protein